MYKVFIDGTVVHDPSLDDPAVLVRDGVIKKNANVADLFTFTAEPGSRAFEVINKLTSVVEVYKDFELLFRGRATKSSEVWTGTTTYECESWFAVFNDTIMRPYEYTGSVRGFVQQIVNQHNEQVPAAKQFTLRTVTVTDPNNTIVRSSSDYSTTMQVLQDKLVGSSLGGYLVAEYSGGSWYLDYLADGTGSSGQKITIAKNLIDFLREQNAENIATGIIPLGAKDEDTEERLTIKSVNGGRDYITDPAAVARYGLIFTTQVWDDVTVASNLLTKAQAALTDYTSIIPNIKLTAVDLSITDQDIDPVRLLDYVTVEDDHHDASGRYLVTERTYNLSAPERDTVTFGGSKPSISGAAAKTAAEVDGAEARILSTASSRAKAILENSTAGNIYCKYGNDGRCYEIDIMDTDNPETATKIWRWNIGGWGYSNDGGQTYITAATMDGAILASIITTGILRSNDGTTFYLDLDHGILRGNFNELKIGASNAATQSYANNAASTAASAAGAAAQQSAIDAAAQALNDFITGDYAQEIANLQSQIDGQIETYFNSYIPTISNAPANAWTTTTDKDNHLGDLFYVVDNPDHGGECYRFALIEGAYGWQLVEDSAVANALRQAQEAFALAGTKKRVFTTQPVPPYDVGDLSVDGSDLWICGTPRSTGGYVASDWSLATNYVDGADVDAKITAYDGMLTQSAIFNKLTNNGQEQGLYYSNGKIYLNAEFIGTGYLSADRIEANSISVSKLTGSIKDSGDTWNIDLTNGTITIGNISAAKITTGTLSADRIGANSITAGKLDITELNAIGATIGGFKIETNSLHTNGVAITSNADNSVGLSSSTFTRTIGGTSRSGLKFALGGNFGVTKNGTVYCYSAVIDYATITNASITNGSIAINAAAGSTSYITLTFKTNYYATMSAGRFVVRNSDNGFQTQYEGGGILTHQYSNMRLRMSCTATGGLYFVNADNVTTARYPENSKDGYVYLGMATSSSSYNSLTVTNIEQYRAFALCTMRGQGVGVMATTIIPQAIAKLCDADNRCSWVYCAQNGNYHGQCYFAWSSGRIYLKGSANADSRLYIYGIR